MKVDQLTGAEEELAILIWDREPIKSSDLVKLCEQIFQWKKSTTYTMLKRVEEKGVIENKDSILRSLLSKEEYDSKKSRSFLDDHFGGSLPRFLTAFIKENSLSSKDIEELEAIIKNYEE